MKQVMEVAVMASARVWNRVSTVLPAGCRMLRCGSKCGGFHPAKGDNLQRLNCANGYDAILPGRCQQHADAFTPNTSPVRPAQCGVPQRVGQPHRPGDDPRRTQAGSGSVHREEEVREGAVLS